MNNVEIESAGGKAKTSRTIAKEDDGHQDGSGLWSHSLGT